MTTSNGAYTIDEPPPISQKDLNKNNSNFYTSGKYDRQRHSRDSEMDFSGLGAREKKKKYDEKMPPKNWQSKEHSASQEQLNLLHRGGYENASKYNSRNYQQGSSADSQSWIQAIGHQGGSHSGLGGSHVSGEDRTRDQGHVNKHAQSVDLHARLQESSGVENMSGHFVERMQVSKGESQQ